MKQILASVIVLFVATTLVACQSEKSSETKESASAMYTTMTVQQLHERLSNKDFTLINVHIPYAGEIPQTDLFIPYNEIEQQKDKLPADKSAKLVLYCRSGSMSEIAAKTLVNMGYTNVVDVPGGMIAWESAGYELLKQQAPK